MTLQSRKLGMGSAMSGKPKLHRRHDSIQDEKTARFIRELVASSPGQRNYKGIFIALLVICGVCGIIFLATIIFGPPDDGLRVKGRKLTLEDLTPDRYRGCLDGTWISGHEVLFQNMQGQIDILDAVTSEVRQVAPATRFGKVKAKHYTISPDRQFILFAHAIEHKFGSEHLFLAEYTVHDIEERHEYPLRVGENKSLVLQHVEWGPKDHALILIYNNDIYYRANPYPATENVQITTTGQLDLIYNGIPDWLYNIRIFKNRKGFWMSPDDKMMVYISFNDSEVGEANFHWYGDDAPYPPIRAIRYPKAGTPNPEVKIWGVVLDTEDIRPIPVQIPKSVDPRDHYISTVNWIGDEQVSVVWMNRQQNAAVFATCSSVDWQCKEFYLLKPPGLGWLDFPPAPIFSSDKSSCLLRIPWRDGEAGYFHHVIWLDIKSGKEIPITSGSYDVTEISAWDQISHTIYFIGAPQKTPEERHLYQVSDQSVNSSIISPPVCLTCCVTQNGFLDLETKNSTVSNSEIDYCLYNKVSFSPSREYFLRECLGPQLPFTTLHRSVTPHDHIFILDDNGINRMNLVEMALPVVQIMEIEISTGMAQVKLYLPPGFIFGGSSNLEQKVRRGTKDFKFPFLLYLDGSPGTQLASEKWDLNYPAYLSSQKNFIVAEIDARGAGFQGENIRQGIYQKLGPSQVDDQMEVIKFLLENETYSYFIDERNMAVMGRGFGGYLTLFTLAKDTTNIFQCGIAVSPITKWESYESAYSERYLGLPTIPENYHGYEEGDLIRKAKDLQGRKFLIIHGTADEIVQYEHTLHLTKELIKQGITFSEQIYPDEGHDLGGVADHFYKRMETYLDDCFEKPDWSEWEKADFPSIPGETME